MVTVWTLRTSVLVSDLMHVGTMNLVCRLCNLCPRFLLCPVGDAVSVVGDALRRCAAFPLQRSSMLSTKLAGMRRVKKVRSGGVLGLLSVTDWFESLSDYEIRVVLAFLSCERYAELDQYAVEARDLTTGALSRLVCDRCDEALGFCDDFLDFDDLVAMARWESALLGRRRLAKTLDHCMATRNKRKHSAAAVDPLAESRVDDLKLLVYRLRLESPDEDLIKALASTWTGTVPELLERSAAMAHSR
jgi:hypothetical protein